MDNANIKHVKRKFGEIAFLIAKAIPTDGHMFYTYKISIHLYICKFCIRILLQNMIFLH